MEPTISWGDIDNEKKKNTQVLTYCQKNPKCNYGKWNSLWRDVAVVEGVTKGTTLIFKSKI